MSKALISVFSLLLSSVTLGNKFFDPHSKINEPQNSVCFTENKGQVSDQYFKPRPDILFGGSTSNIQFHLRKSGVSYQLTNIESWKNDLNDRGETIKSIDNIKVYRLDLEWINCNQNAEIIRNQALGGFTNYYLAVCKAGVTKVRSYREVLYKGLYPGIDVRWYSKNGELKYDYICAPGSDYRQVQLKINGAQKIHVNTKGDLEIITSSGTIVEQAPLVTQGNRQLKSYWRVAKNIVSFQIEGVNPSQNLIIDPLIRLWGTYYGDTGNELQNGCARDASGNIYISGNTSTNPSTLIATVGSYQTTYGGGMTDAFLAKFDQNGTRIWATYYGGAGSDDGKSCATDLYRNVYMSGTTDSSSGMATPGAQQTISGGAQDAFLVKFDSNGVRQWATYYGDSGADASTSCITDNQGNIYMAGYSNASTGTIIATAGSHQPVLGGGLDGFLAKFDSNGIRQWSTYYGGTAADNLNSTAIDVSGYVYISGYTNSGGGTVIATPGAHQTQYSGQDDAFLAKFDGNGIRQWGTYYGGTGMDVAWGCSTDPLGNVFMSGHTSSSGGTVIATANSHQTIYGGGTFDGFLVKFDSSGTRLWGTYYGGTALDRIYATPAMNNGNLYILGITGSTNNIATPNSYQSTMGGWFDGFIAKFNSSGIRQWGSFYGDQGSDQIHSGCLNSDQTLYIAGHTYGNTGGTVFATPGAYQTVQAGGYDTFLARFEDCIQGDASNATPAGNQTLCAVGSATLNAVGNGTINWYATPASTLVLGSGTVFITPTLSAGVYTYYAEDAACISSPTRAAVSVTVVVCTSVQETPKTTRTKVYPNPTNGIITIEQDYQKELKISLYDVMGSLIFTRVVDDKRFNVSFIDLPAGIYYLALDSNNEIRKFFKVIRE